MQAALGKILAIILSLIIFGFLYSHFGVLSFFESVEDPLTDW